MPSSPSTLSVQSQEVLLIINTLAWMRLFLKTTIISLFTLSSTVLVSGRAQGESQGSFPSMGYLHVDLLQFDTGRHFKSPLVRDEA